MSAPTLEIRRSSASLWGGQTGVRQLPVVSKYIDTSTCIGCKACEVACQEWNDLPVGPDPADRHLPDDARRCTPEFWNLIRFNEQEYRGGLAWLMRKDQCMHCEDPGCLAACPAPGAIVQYENGIVDVNPDAVHRLRVLRDGLPLRRAQVPGQDGQDGEVHAVRGPRGRGPGARLHQGLPHRLPPVRHQGRHAGARPSCASQQLKANGFAQATALRSAGRGRHGRGHRPGPRRPSRVVRAARATHTCRYAVRFWKSVLRPLGFVAIVGAVLGAFGHFMNYGPKEPREPGEEAP